MPVDIPKQREKIPGWIGGIESRFEQIQARLQSPELAKELMTVQAKAETTIGLMRQLLDSPDGDPTDAITQHAESLLELYREAEQIFGRAMDHQIMTAFRAPTMDDAETAMEDQLEAAKAECEEMGLPHLTDPLETIVKKLQVRTGDILTGDTKKRGPYLFDESQLLSLTSGTDKDIAHLEKMMPQYKGKTRELACNLLCALKGMRSVDKVNADRRDFYKSISRGMNTGPARKILAMVAIPIVLLGLWQTVRGRGFSPATLIWAVVAAFALKPDLLRGLGTRAEEEVARMGNPDTRRILECKGFGGPNAAKAYEELQDLWTDAEGKKMITDFRSGKRDGVTEGEVAMLTGGTDSALYQELAKLPSDKDRKAVFDSLLGECMRDEDIRIFRQTVVEGAGR